MGKFSISWEAYRELTQLEGGLDLTWLDLLLNMQINDVLLLVTLAVASELPIYFLSPK